MSNTVKPNARFMINKAKSISVRQAVDQCEFLDFGCGIGSTVFHARAEGVSMWGADTFDGYYEEWITKLPTEVAEYIKRIDSGLPFEDGFFEGVISNQVFEHIEYPERSLIEIGRVLRAGGKLVIIFPDAGVLREGHIGLWMPHWFRGWQSGQRIYLKICYYLGMGRKRQHGVDGWWKTINEVTFYHDRDQFIALAEDSVGGKAVDITENFLEFRLRNSRGSILVPLLRLPGLKQIMIWFARRHAGIILEIEKEKGRGSGV